MQKHREKDPPKRSQHDETGGPRHEPIERGGTLAVRLTRKYANMIDGVNIADAHVGDRLELPQHDAEMLIAEGWAEYSPRRSTHTPQPAHATDKPRRKTSRRP